MKRHGMNLLLALAAGVVFLLCLRFGSAQLSLQQVMEGLFSGQNTTHSAILQLVRLPRAAAAALAGAGLAMSGALLQAATGNPLAGPNIIGVNAGAGLAVVAVWSFAPNLVGLTPVAAFFGAFGCTLLIAAISRFAGGGRTTVVLSGVAISALMNAGISGLKLLYPDSAVSYTDFAIGSVGSAGFDRLKLPAMILVACFAMAMAAAPRIDLLCLGDSMAQSLGVRAKGLRTFTLLLASACAGAAVSFAGLLGFVGLMVPHIARRLVGGRMTTLLPACCLLGAILVMLADLVGRVAFAPSELPAGMITAVLGVPFFLMLLKRRAVL